HSSVERIIIPDSTIALDYILHKFIWLIKNLLVRPENMKTNLEKTRGSIFSQTILLKLVKKGLTKEDAYEIVQHISMEAVREKKDFKTVLLKNKKMRDILSREEIKESFNIRTHLKNIKEIYKRFGI
ncbi:adenylosuccinate lyase, partial [bacterium]|nr:adenylosuccinate lyase [bacterium]